jgi:hypothetical protein
MERFFDALGREWPRILTALGAVVAPVGLVFFGMGIAYREPLDLEINAGITLMVVGLAAFFVGLGAMRMGLGGDQYRLDPAQPATPHQAVHPSSAPGQAVHEDDRTRL